ncbi:hypothetical protein APR48_17555 [Variovorax paradoxus]|nr:hypothetical protein APR48_17555 [Variovorax paradoxus]KPV33227.1 hypothetical protein APR47_17940 [Variovorax paradoxus]
MHVHDAALLGLSALLAGAVIEREADDANEHDEAADEQDGLHAGRLDQEKVEGTHDSSHLLLAVATLRAAKHGPIGLGTEQLATNASQVLDVRAILLRRAVDLPLADGVMTVDLVTTLVQLAHQRGLAARSIYRTIQGGARGEFIAVFHEQPF